MALMLVCYLERDIAASDDLLFSDLLHLLVISSTVPLC